MQINITKSVLCILIGGFIGAASAQENGASQLPFFADSTLDFSTRNIFKFLQEEETGERLKHMAWGQGIALDYKSGYLADFIGVDTSYYGVVKLGASDYFATRGILYNENPGSKPDKDNAKGFNKVGQLYGKVKLGDEHLKANLYGGLKRLDKFGALTTSTQGAPNTYLGWSGDISFDQYRFRLGYVTRSLNRDSPYRVEFLTQDRKKIDYIVTGDVGYKSDLLALNYFFGESQDYLQRHGLEMEWKATDKLQLGSQIYGTEALGKWKAMPDSRPGKLNSKDFDQHAWFYALDATWKEDNWFTKFGLAYTDAPKTNGIGQFPRHISRNSRGTFNAMTSAGLDYMRDGETTFSVATGYNLTPDWVTGIRANAGFFSYEGKDIREGEVNLYTRWTPKDKTLKGLSVFAMFGPGISYQQKNRVPLYDSHGNVKRSRSMAAEVIIDYKFNIF